MKTATRSHSTSELVGEPNQTYTRECNTAAEKSATSQAQVTVRSSVKSIVREAILKFSEGGKNEIQSKKAPQNVKKIAETYPFSSKLPCEETPYNQNKNQKRGEAMPQPVTTETNHPTHKIAQESEKKDPPPPINQKVQSNPARSVKGGEAVPPPVTTPAKQKTKPPINPNPPSNQTLAAENQTSSQTKRDAFKIMLERKRNSDQKPELPKTKPKVKTNKQKPNQGREQVKKPNQAIHNTNQNQTTKPLKINLRQPTLFHVKKPPLTSINVEPEEKPSEMTETKPKPTEGTIPPETKPSVEETKYKPNTLQEMMKKATPETKTKPVSTTKPARQPGKPKPKPKTSVVETNDLKLFLEKKMKEREMNLKGKSVVVTTTNQKPSPETHCVSATLSQINTSPTQSAPRASIVRAQRLPDSSTDSSTSNQGDQIASASNEGYQI